ncbi:MAG TPA: hypothetical protein GXZ52_00620 [Clostridiales bacterium]|jgi:hypothetical protein|nr:hypothetical protein [Clostridiales bacterium]
MTGYVSDCENNVYKLPALLDWELCYGWGEPCDAFRVVFLYEPEQLDMLSRSVRFWAEHEGERVFYGVVDEFEVRAGKEGMLAFLRGRGLAALLMDNEAEAAQYGWASLDFILDRHVYPWGITRVKADGFTGAAAFKVESGDSQWKVLRDYARLCCRVRPRFSKDGVLMLTREPGDIRSIDGHTAIISQMYRQRRYGVISSVLVKNRGGWASRLVENGDFLARGGNCRRVLNVPRNTGYDAMGYAGEYQIRQSELDSVLCRLTLPSLFAAFPGDVVRIKDSPLGISREFSVFESRCWANARDAGTEISLVRQEDGYVAF